MKKETVVIHSGGMDSSICLKIAVDEQGKENVLSLSFRYDQRHSSELVQAEKICRDWNVDHAVIPLPPLKKLTNNALVDPALPIKDASDTLVAGRNGLMARLGAIYADSLGAQSIMMGVLELDEANSGYRDCSRHYMNLMEEILRIDLDNPDFTIRTPLIRMTKVETMQLAKKHGVLDYLLENTVTCYRGILKEGCRTCPACLLRNEGIEQFQSLARVYI